MPRQRIDHSRTIYVFPDDFPQRLVRFKEASGLSWAELARRLGTSPLNLRRWRDGVRPHLRHLMALLDLAEEMGLTHLFTAWRLRNEAFRETSSPPRAGYGGRRVPGPPRRPLVPKQNTFRENHVQGQA